MSRLEFLFHQLGVVVVVAVVRSDDAVGWDIAQSVAPYFADEVVDIGLPLRRQCGDGAAYRCCR